MSRFRAVVRSATSEMWTCTAPDCSAAAIVSISHSTVWDDWCGEASCANHEHMDMVREATERIYNNEF